MIIFCTICFAFWLKMKGQEVEIRWKKGEILEPIKKYIQYVLVSESWCDLLWLWRLEKPDTTFNHHFQPLPPLPFFFYGCFHCACFLNMFKSFHLNDSDNWIQKHFVIHISGLQTKDSVDKVTRHGECNVFSGQMTHVYFGSLYQLPFSCRERKGEFARL